MAKCSPCSYISDKPECKGCVFGQYFKTEDYPFLLALCTRYTKKVVQNALIQYAGDDLGAQTWIQLKLAEYQIDEYQNRQIEEVQSGVAKLTESFGDFHAKVTGQIEEVQSSVAKLTESFGDFHAKVSGEFVFLNNQVDKLLEESKNLSSRVDHLLKEDDKIYDILAQIIMATNIRIVGHGYPHEEANDDNLDVDYALPDLGVAADENNEGAAGENNEDAAGENNVIAAGENNDIAAGENNDSASVNQAENEVGPDHSFEGSC